ncbi:MAG: hypothetical protein LBL71_02325 [Endomicrobium sp.]|jgi:hypothetical protein|nr:hypothetical protein [Endomicrobium sp.]
MDIVNTLIVSIFTVVALYFNKISLDIKENNDKFRIELKEENIKFRTEMKEENVKFRAELRNENDKFREEIKQSMLDFEQKFLVLMKENIEWRQKLSEKKP